MNRRYFLEAVGMMGTASLLASCRSRESRGFAVSTRPSPTEKPPSVLRIHDGKAASWDYGTGQYIQAIDGDIVYSMITEGLLALTGKKTPKEAWRDILTGYETGQRVAIKPNLNNTQIGYGQAIMTSPQVISGVIRSLVEDGGVPPYTIFLYDLTADPMPEIQAIVDTFRVRTVWILDRIALKMEWGDDAPDQSAAIPMRKPVAAEDGTPVTCYLPKVLTKAHHLINLPVLKAHQYIVTSSALKNHFGTVRFSNHHQYPPILHGPDIQSHIVDINAHPVVAERTRLILADALLGAPLFARGDIGRAPTRWHTLPEGATPSSIFLSRDPVAIESVIADYVIEEQHNADVVPHPDAYLADAMSLGLGVFERRDANGDYHAINYRRIEHSRALAAPRRRSAPPPTERG